MIVDKRILNDNNRLDYFRNSFSASGVEDVLKCQYSVYYICGRNGNFVFDVDDVYMVNPFDYLYYFVIL